MNNLQNSNTFQKSYAGVINAYNSGMMSAKQAMDFEKDVRSGEFAVPEWFKLKEQYKPYEDPKAAPHGILNAYSKGEMTNQQRIDFENDVRNGEWNLPQGFKISVTEPLGILGTIKESITGEDRSTQETKKLRDWTELPELNELSAASFKTALGTLASNADETAQILKSNYPNLQVRQDNKGNYIYKSAKTGEEFAYKPGFEISDIPRAAFQLAAFTPASKATTIGGAALKNAATQGVIEGSQAATGGEFNSEDVAIAGAIGGAIPAIGKTISASKQLISKTPKTNVALKEGESAALKGIDNAAAKQAETELLNKKDLIGVTQSASNSVFGKEKALSDLAEQVAPNQKIIDAAKRLQVQDDLMPSHVSNNQVYRELEQAILSFPGSEGRALEAKGLENVAKRADKIIYDLGGTKDFSSLTPAIKNNLIEIQDSLYSKSEDLYKKLAKNIPARANVDTNNIVSFLKETADNLGGEEYLSPRMRKLLKELSPKQINKSDGTKINTYPTYDLLDLRRKEIGQALRNNTGAFKDSESGILSKIYKELSDDQSKAAAEYGQLKLFNLAKSSVAARKRIEENMVSLFGKNLEGSIVNKLTSSINQLPKGVNEGFVSFIESIPEANRKEVIASALGIALGNSSKSGRLNIGNYNKFYEGLVRNKKSYAALMNNLPKEARKTLSDFYRVTKGIQNAIGEKITTGRLSTVQELKNADSFIGRLGEFITKGTAGVAAEKATSSIGLPGLGIGSFIAASLIKGRKNAISAADQVLTSPEFLNAVKNLNTKERGKSISRLALSKKFNNFYLALKKPREMSNKEKWVLQAFNLDTNFNKDNEKRGN